MGDIYILDRGFLLDPVGAWSREILCPFCLSQFNVSFSLYYPKMMFYFIFLSSNVAFFDFFGSPLKFVAIVYIFFLLRRIDHQRLFSSLNPDVCIHLKFQKFSHSLSSFNLHSSLNMV